MIILCTFAAAGSAIVAVRTWNAPDRWYRAEVAKETATMRAIEALGDELTGVYVRDRAYPPSIDPRSRDGWGFPFHYASRTWKNDGPLESTFVLISAGADGVLEERSRRLLTAIGDSGGDWLGIHREYSRDPVPMNTDWQTYSSRDIVFATLFLQQHPVSSTENRPGIPRALRDQARRAVVLPAILSLVFTAAALAVHFVSRPGAHS